MSKLPNLWVHHQEPIGASLFCEAIPECYSLSVRSSNNHLYVPAARLIELVEKWRDRQECLEYCRNNDVCAAELEALLKEPGE